MVNGTMLKTAAGPLWILEAGKTYRMTDAMFRDLSASQVKLDQRGHPDHGKMVTVEPACKRCTDPKAKVLKIPLQPDPEDVPMRPDEDEITQDDAEE